MAPGNKPSPDSGSSSDRRKRSRLRGTTPGWVMAGDSSVLDPWEVRVRDVSRHGVGFESTERFDNGQVVRIRIGRGPLELARRIRVVRCNPGQTGTYSIGGEFV